MSLYREAGRRSALPLLVSALAIALVAGIAGYLIGAGGEEEPSLEDAIGSVREQLQPALSELELVTIEYSEAVRDGEVVAETEYGATVDHVERAEETLESARADLELLAPDELGRAERGIAELATLVDDLAPGPQVNAAAQATAEAIREITGSPPPAG